MSLYKPSPLSFGSPRTSPFRRPESPASPSTTLRPTTPTTSPTKAFTSPTKPPNSPLSSPTKLQTSNGSPLSNSPTWNTPRSTLTPRRELAPSPTRAPSNTNGPSTAATTSHFMSAAPRQLPLNNDPLSKLPPAQVREMREAFEILDRDMDGQVTRDDIIDMLTNLGLPTPPSTLQSFFPPPTPHPLPLAPFLATLSSLLTPLSPTPELLSAFAAFDDDDSGQIDVHELRDALLHTSALDANSVSGASSSSSSINGGSEHPTDRALSPDDIDTVIAGFSGRRAFGGSSSGGGAGAGAGRAGAGAGRGRAVTGARGEVFRYREFVANVGGAGADAGTGAKGGKRMVGGE